VYPAFENRVAANGRKTIAARLSAFNPDSFVEPVAEAAIFQRWNVRKKSWADVDPPSLLVRMALAGAPLGLPACERHHHHAHIAPRRLAAGYAGV